MEQALSNLKELYDDMKRKHWTISSFTFVYKKVSYIVLVKRFVGETRRVNKYALVSLEFMKEANVDDRLIVEANSIKLIVETKRLREYFGIEYSENLGDILEQFKVTLNVAIPAQVKVNFSASESAAMVRSLSSSDAEDPRKVYCTHVKRNPEGKTRSEFNADKTRLLRPRLFARLRGDESISFCYSINPEDEKDDATILSHLDANR